MDIVKYSANVKDFKQSELLTVLDTVTSGATVLKENLVLLRNSGIDLSKEEGSWFIPASLLKVLSSNGFRHKHVYDPLEYCASVVELITKDLATVIKGINQNIWSGKVLTVKQALVLRTLEHLQFWVKYAEMMVSTLVSMSNDKTQPDTILVKDDAKWLNGTKGFFESYTLTLMRGSRYTKELIDKAPDLLVDDSTVEILEGVGDKNVVELTKQSFGIHNLTPVFWISLAKSKIQLKRIENMRSRNAQFAMKISQAINRKNGEPDPKLDHMIEVYQDAISKNEAAIEAIEKSYE